MLSPGYRRLNDDASEKGRAFPESVKIDFIKVMYSKTQVANLLS